jgi:hypothetical protein
METAGRGPGKEHLLAAAAAVLLIAGMVPAWFGGDDEEVWGFVVFVVLSLLLLGLLLFRLLPRRRAAPGPGNPPARAGLVTGVLAVLTIAVFWTGFPIALGAGAVALGLAGRERAAAEGRGGLATAAVALGGVAAIGGFAILLTG